MAGNETEFLTADEIENLTIRAGTLTAAERQIINHHIDVTIQMLEALPWPKHLKNVPEYAGGHHERMDGKGYPRGLTRDQMSVQARCMGIADIFEALTAKDRPYKKGKTLSESLPILGKFKLDGHIDPDSVRCLHVGKSLSQIRPNNAWISTRSMTWILRRCPVTCRRQRHNLGHLRAISTGIRRANRNHRLTSSSPLSPAFFRRIGALLCATLMTPSRCCANSLIR